MCAYRSHPQRCCSRWSWLSLDNGAWDIVSGHDGKLWFTEDTLSAFGPITAGDGLISEFTGLLTVAGAPKGITKGPDGNLWIAEAGLGGAIARVTPEGAVTEFTASLSNSDPWDITAGPDGTFGSSTKSPRPSSDASRPTARSPSSARA